MAVSIRGVTVPGRVIISKVGVLEYIFESPTPTTQAPITISGGQPFSFGSNTNAISPLTITGTNIYVMSSPTVTGLAPLTITGELIYVISSPTVTTNAPVTITGDVLQVFVNNTTTEAPLTITGNT